MSDQPQTWHYGLMARWWEEFSEVIAEEIAFFRSLIERSGQPALDLACGTGRVLLPLLEVGLDVDGCDLSPDMLAVSVEKAARAGYAPNLYEQAMHALDLPRRYRTIYICNSFGIGGRRDQDAEALRRCYEHLGPEGTLVFNHYLPYHDPGEWSCWLPEQHRRLPKPWPELGTTERRRASNGDEYELQARILDLDPIEQRLTRQMRLALWRDGKIVAVEEGELQENLYFLNELPSLLAGAGFEDVSVQGGYTGLPATPDQTMVTFVARK